MSTYVGYFPYEKFATEVHNSFVTAIVTVYTSEGFIMGADGLAIDGVSGEAVKNIQKIFLFEKGTTRLAYAWTGTTEVYDKEGRGGWDLGALSKVIIPTAEKGGDFAAFLTIFCEALRYQLPQIDNCPKSEIARVRFVGYFHGIPCSGNVRIAHSNGFLTPYNDQVRIPAEPHKSVFSGAQSVSSKYSDWMPDSEERAIDFVRQYIQDCVDSPDSDCAGIGGRLHIVKITPAKLLWVLPPVQVSNPSVSNSNASDSASR
jgi:hypothetical protein